MSLLLYLIREQEMDIFDIDIAKITNQYLEYIRSMKTLDLELAGDFVAMAATLLHIKSRMLLPQHEQVGEIVEQEDPRRELVQRLLEYEKFQEASRLLKERPWVGRDVWLRGERVDLAAAQDDSVILEDNPLYSLISSYRKAVRSMKSGIHRVFGAMQSIASRILEIKDQLVVGQRLEFGQLVVAEGEARPNQVLVTFLSLLELAKMGFVSLFQADTYGQIQIEPKRAIDGNVVSQVESYENIEAEQVAESIMAESEMAQPNEPAEPALEEMSAATDEEIEAEERRMEGEEPAL